jgi:hypothetical protein
MGAVAQRNFALIMRFTRWLLIYRVFTKKWCVSQINKKFISHLTRAKRTPSAAAIVNVLYALSIILQCVDPGSHDSHPHDNRIRTI